MRDLPATNRFDDIDEVHRFATFARILGDYPAGLPLLALAVGPWLWGTERGDPILLLDVVLMAVVGIANIWRAHAQATRSRETEVQTDP